MAPYNFTHVFSIFFFLNVPKGIPKNVLIFG
jgi:hypothetical protein